MSAGSRIERRSSINWAMFLASAGRETRPSIAGIPKWWGANLSGFLARARTEFQRRPRLGEFTRGEFIFGARLPYSDDVSDSNEAAQSPYGATNRVGRLVEAWANKLESVADVTAFGLAAARAITGVRGSVVVCTDYGALTTRESHILHSPEFLKVFKRANMRIERAALISPQGVPELRSWMRDLVREANHGTRQLFDSGAEAQVWLAPLLAPEEQARLTEFLEERSPISSACGSVARRASSPAPL